MRGFEVRMGLGGHDGDFAESVAASMSQHFALEKIRMREEIEQADHEMAAGVPVTHVPAHTW